MSRNVIINFVLFQLVWFMCVIGAAHNSPWLGVAVAFGVVIWHLLTASNSLAELKLLLCAIVIGGLFDQAMLSSHLISYAAHGWNDNLVPAWILGLWLGFTTTLNVSLRWMRHKWLVAILFGFIGGPLAYLGAVKLGAVVLNQMPQTYFALAIGWGVLTPLLIKLSEHLDGFRPMALKS